MSRLLPIQLACLTNSEVLSLKSICSGPIQSQIKPEFKQGIWICEAGEHCLFVQKVRLIITSYTENACATCSKHPMQIVVSHDPIDDASMIGGIGGPPSRAPDT